MSKVPKILLIGNGINRAFGESAWNDLLAEMSCTSFDEEEQKLIEQLPYSLQAVVMSGGNVGEGIKLIAERLIDEPVSNEQVDIIRDLVTLPFTAVLTTNYTYDIEKSLKSDFSCSMGRPCKFRKKIQKGTEAETQFGIFKYMQVGEEYPGIWHIHGEAGLDKSMIIGHYYYGKLLSCIYQQVSGVIRRYNAAKKNGEEFVLLSWIDYFLTSDVYIVGLGLDPSETDLWWLINFKNIYADKLGNGKVYWFEPNMKADCNFHKYVLAKTYNVEIITEKVGNKQYKKYYRGLISQIDNIIESV